MSAAGDMTLAILGGSSPATPVLIEALRRAQGRGQLGALEVRLYGRNRLRLRGIRNYVNHSLRGGRDRAEERPLPALVVTAATALPQALTGATHIVCMVRPGGMAGRAEDELFARRAGAVADEGLGIGGLRCYLRGRELIVKLAEACAQYAPRAHLLQMSSPLGLNVALSRRAHGDRVVGVCELPRTTAQKLASRIQTTSGLCWKSHSHAGLNHQSWLYAFRDAEGRDLTPAVLDSLPSGEEFGVASARIRELGAVPVHYLKLFFHSRRVRGEQRRARIRGRVLAQWAQQVEDALCRPAGPDAVRVARLLAQRRMDWFDEGIVPVLAALQQRRAVSLPLNVSAGAAMPGAPKDAIVEIDCDVSTSGVRPRAVPALPAGPAALTQALLNYERSVLELPAKPTERGLADALAWHPLAPRGQIRSLARALADVRPETA